MKVIAVATLALFLVACGGGGSSTPPAAQPQAPQGVTPITAPLTLGTAKWGQAVWH